MPAARGYGLECSTATWRHGAPAGIAEATFGLSLEAAKFVDAQVAPFAHRIGIAALERLVAEAIARCMPDRAAQDAKAADGRHFTIEHQQVSFNGTSQISGELDLADALDLDAAVAQGAETLKTLGSTESLDVRRSIAAGQIARNQLALDLTEATGWSSSERSERTVETTTPHKGTKPRQVMLYVHLSESAITGTSTGLELARVENQRQVVTADQVKAWCASPDAQVAVKPVIDLNEHIHVEGYEVPARLREQTVLHDHTCVFPWCTRSARKADADHVIPYADGGTTSSDNIAPLCRRHHRLKTHSSWTYTMLEPGSLLWSSPHGSNSSATTTAPSTSAVTGDILGPIPRTSSCTKTWSRLTARFARCSTTGRCELSLGVYDLAGNPNYTRRTSSRSRAPSPAGATTTARQARSSTTTEHDFNDEYPRARPEGDLPSRPAASAARRRLRRRRRGRARDRRRRRHHLPAPRQRREEHRRAPHRAAPARVLRAPEPDRRRVRRRRRRRRRASTRSFDIDGAAARDLRARRLLPDGAPAPFGAATQEVGEVADRLRRQHAARCSA